MISTYHTYEMRMSVSRSKEVIKPVVSEWLQLPRGRSWPERSNAATIPTGMKERFWVVCIITVFKRLLNVTIHNIMNQSLQANNKTEPLTFRLHPIKRLTEKHKSRVSQTDMGAHLLNHLLNDWLDASFWRRFLSPVGSLNLTVCSRQGKRKGSIPGYKAGLCLDGCFKSYHTNLHL
jgi:hypothetical protein